MKTTNALFALFVTLLLGLLGIITPARAGDSKYATTSTGGVAAVTFGPAGTAHSQITAISAKSDKSTSVVKLYSFTGANRFQITTASTSGAQAVSFTNASQTITTNDVVVYVHSDGTVLGTTVASGVSTNGVTLATGLSKAGTTNDYIYELTQNFEASVGTTALNSFGFVAFDAPAGPVYATLDGNTNATLSLTRQP